MKDSIDDRTSAIPPSQPLDLPKGRLGWDPEFALYSFSKWRCRTSILSLSSVADIKEDRMQDNGFRELYSLEIDHTSAPCP